jgi:hypothetical protein
MAIPSFFKQNKPRGFNYVPRYYDPVKEEREERLRALRKESDAGKAPEEGQHENQPYRSKIMRGDMKNYFHRNKERVDKHSMIRLLVIIMVMVLAVYIYIRFF